MKYVKLCDLCDFQGGSQPPKDEWSYELKNGYIRMLQIRDFTQKERVVPEYVKITNSTKKCEADDILIARYGASLGKILTGLSGAYNVAIMKTIPDEHVLEKKYLYYYLKSPVFQTFLLNIGNRAAQAGFNKNDLQELFIPSISKKEQAKVVNILKHAETIISVRQKQLQKLDELVKSRFVEIFGDFNLSFQRPEWQYVSDIGTVIGGSTPKTNIEEYWNGEYRWLSPAELKPDSGIIYDSVKKITKLGIESCSLQELPIGTVILTSRAPIGKLAIAGNTFYCNQGFKNIVCKEKVRTRYLYYLFLFNTDYLNSLGRGATFKEISKSIVENIRIPVPELTQQIEFEKFIEQIDKSKIIIQQALDKTQLLFDSLMQCYFGS